MHLHGVCKNSLRKQTDFLPVALCHRKIPSVFFGGAKQQVENPSVFAGQCKNGHNLIQEKLVEMLVSPLFISFSSDQVMKSLKCLVVPQSHLRLKNELSQTWSCGFSPHLLGFENTLSKIQIFNISHIIKVVKQQMQQVQLAVTDVSCWLSVLSEKAVQTLLIMMSFAEKHCGSSLSS